MIRGRAREMGLGSFDNLTLEKAREIARTLWEGVHQKTRRRRPGWSEAERVFGIQITPNVVTDFAQRL